MIFLGSDHGGFRLKEDIAEFLEQKGVEYSDLGVFNEEGADYPDIARKLCARVLSAEGNSGILVCGTGIGMSIVANKVAGIRAALCGDVYSAEMSRRHNDANVLCLGGRVVDSGLARDIVQAYMQNEFEGGRHKVRVDSIEN